MPTWFHDAGALAAGLLILREYRQSDFDAFAAHCADPKAMVHWGGLDRRSARRVFAANTGEWMLQGAGWWAVELRASDSMVGAVGGFFRETWPEIELGWHTFRAHWGQGSPPRPQPRSFATPSRSEESGV